MTPEAKMIPGQLLPSPSSKQLYNEVAAGNIKETLPAWPKLAETVKDLGEDVSAIPWDKLKNDLHGSGLESLFSQIQQTLTGGTAKIVKQKPTISGKSESIKTGLPSQNVEISAARAPGMTFEEADAAIRGFNRVINRVSDDTLRGDYIKLKKAMLDDLADMPIPEGVPLQAWRDARNAYKQEKTRMLLSEQIERATTNKEGVEIFYPDRVLKWIRTNDEFKQRVPPGSAEYKAIESRFKEMAQSEGPIMGRLMGIIAGSTFTGGIGGALAGYVAAEKMSELLMTQTGRNIVARMIQNPNASNWRKLGAIAGAATGGLLDAASTRPTPLGNTQLREAP
jgi:hypothetical protein